MGRFDNVRCHYPLPWPEVQDVTWQSYDTPDQYCEHYGIRPDGTLWQAIGEDWEPVAFEGELEIHASPLGGFYSVKLWFRDGRVKDAIFKPATPPSVLAMLDSITPGGIYREPDTSDHTTPTSTGAGARGEQEPPDTT